MVSNESRSTNDPLWQKNLPEATIQNAILPVVGILLVLTLYYVEWRPLTANTSLIKALINVQTGQQAKAIASFGSTAPKSRSVLTRPEGSVGTRHANACCRCVRPDVASIARPSRPHAKQCSVSWSSGRCKTDWT